MESFDDIGGMIRDARDSIERRNTELEKERRAVGNQFADVRKQLADQHKNLEKLTNHFNGVARDTAGRDSRPRRPIMICAARPSACSKPRRASRTPSASSSASRATTHRRASTRPCSPAPAYRTCSLILWTACPRRSARHCRRSASGQTNSYYRLR
jgi:hypothetical protein